MNGRITHCSAACNCHQMARLQLTNGWVPCRLSSTTFSCTNLETL